MDDNGMVWKRRLPTASYYIKYMNYLLKVHSFMGDYMKCGERRKGGV